MKKVSEKDFLRRKRENSHFFREIRGGAGKRTTHVQKKKGRDSAKKSVNQIRLLTREKKEHSQGRAKSMERDGDDSVPVWESNLARKALRETKIGI